MRKAKKSLCNKQAIKPGIIKIHKPFCCCGPNSIATTMAYQAGWLNEQALKKALE